MTPYSWTFDNSMKEKVKKTNELKVRLDFNISIYEKLLEVNEILKNA